MTRPRLSAVEVEVIRLLSQGVKPAQIADLRNTRLNTVRSQIRDIHRKLNVTHTAQVIRYAVQHGIIRIKVLASCQIP